MIYSLLEGEGTTNAASGYGNWIMLAILAVLIVVVVVMYVLGNKKRKKQEQDAKDLINAVKPGNKVKTIGGICGIVVEVDDEENTFVLETGTELSGKSYIKFDRQAIYQTDAVVEKPEANAAAEEPAVEAPAEEAIEAPAEATEVAEVVEETPVAEEAPAEETKGKKSKKND
ncbi:MAG: preprotein translocase subunit YajC [Clostridia bacterium]|nr:preprotein translocase subunit YajC [Clostridia bacterium]